jgi:hypothetical protein
MCLRILSPRPPVTATNRHPGTNTGSRRSLPKTCRLPVPPNTGRHLLTGRHLPALPNMERHPLTNMDRLLALNTGRLLAINTDRHVPKKPYSA